MDGLAVTEHAQQWPNPPAVSREALESDAPVLLALLDSIPSLLIYTQSSPDFESLRQLYNLAQKVQPLALVRPVSETEVAKTVRFCADNGIPVAARAGGHDSWGRSLVQGGVVVDMRAINHVRISGDRKSARIGAGVLAGRLLSSLDAEKLMTPTGFCNTVGYIGWAVGGGYGILEGAYGMGCDQIIGARLATVTGAIVSTEDDPELLWAMRGAGNGNFGVILELHIKVYPRPNMFAGQLAFPYSQTKDVFAALGKLSGPDIPDAFAGDFMLAKIPHVGPSVLMLFCWVQEGEDFNHAKLYLEKLRSAGTVLLDTVGQTTPVLFGNSLEPLTSIPVPVNFRSRTVSGLSEDVIDVLNDHEPRTESCILIGHSAHGRASRANAETSFPNRRRHIVLGFQEAPGSQWADPLAASLTENKLALQQAYGSFTGPEESDTDGFFGTTTANRLRVLKKKYDGEGVFVNAYPKLI